MKTALVTLAIAAGMFAVSASAEEYLSPKAREARASLAVRSGTEVRQSFEFARGKAAAASNSIVAGRPTDRNLVKEDRAIVYTGKNPLRDTRTFEIAPVK